MQNLRIIASSRAPEKENMAGNNNNNNNNSDDRRRKRRVADEGCSTLMAMQNLEKERASLKISQSLAEARIRVLEKELASNRRKSPSETETTEVPRVSITSPE